MPRRVRPSESYEPAILALIDDRVQRERLRITPLPNPVKHLVDIGPVNVELARESRIT